MRVFITGATGWVGSAVVKELIDTGHQVTGLTRSKENADALVKLGGQPVLGSMTDLDVLRKNAEMVDGVIHTAFGLDMSKIVELSAEDKAAIEAFGDVYKGSARPLIVAGGIGLYPRGEVFTEEKSIGPVIPAFPRATEQTAIGLAETGVRSTVVRLPRSVHGMGEKHGFIPQLGRLAREKGVSAYVEDGENLWPAVHRLDAARVFRLALEHKAEGGPFHAVAEEAVPYRAIAEAIGKSLQLPVTSLTQEEAAKHFGMMSMFIGGNGPASSEQTRQRLGWNPTHPSLLDDISQPEYFTHEVVSTSIFGSSES